MPSEGESFSGSSVLNFRILLAIFPCYSLNTSPKIRSTNVSCLFSGNQYSGVGKAVPYLENIHQRETSTVK